MGEEFCKICNGKSAKYHCPRCNILYCSVNCYKSQQHLECSEGFYRENVVQELALRRSEDEAAGSTKSMLDILQRIERADSPDEDSTEAETDPDAKSTDSDDDEQEGELAARLIGIDLENCDHVWERLTGAEKEEFHCLVESGAIINVLPTLACWWTQEYAVDLVQPVDERSQQEQKLLSSCPPVWSAIPVFKDLFSKEPSPTVRFNIANILAAYSFVYRYFYGDIHGNALEATDCLLGICMNLKKNAVFDSESMAVESVTNECMNEKLPTDGETTSAMKDHVRTFMAGPKGCGKKFRKFFLLAAVSDVRSLLSRANRELKESCKGKAIVKRSAETIPKPTDIVDVSDLKHVEGALVRSCEKKIDFFLAYVASDFF